MFDEFDYWAGTVSLVLFALFEIILFGWVFGMKKGWKEINLGADIKIPVVYRFIIKYITPALLLAVFIGALVTPEGNNWLGAFGNLFNGDGWILDNTSLIMKITNAGLYQEIASASPEMIPALERKILLINGTRLLLISLFAGIALMVYLASRKINKSLKQTP